MTSRRLIGSPELRISFGVSSSSLVLFFFSSRASFLIVSFFFCFCHWFSKKISSFEAISLRKIREHPEGGASLGRKKKNFEKPTRLEGRLEGRREQRLGHSRSRADDPASTQGQCLRANSDHHRPSIKEESSRRPPEGLIKDVSDERISLSLSLSPNQKVDEV